MDPFDFEFLVSSIRLFAILCLGLCLGSFATALIYRIPNDIPWVVGNKKDGVAARSKCPSCKTKLGVLDLVPIFSWVLARGKCRYCQTPIPYSYPVTELVTATLVLVLYFVWGWDLVALPLYLAVPFLVAAAKIDWDHMVLPDDLNISLAVLAAAYLFFLWSANADRSEILNHVAAGILLPATFGVISFILKRLRGRDALGMGDIKFLAPAGLMMGLGPIPAFMVAAGVIGIITALLKKSYHTGAAFPFGPALIISMYLHVFLTGLGFH